MVWVGRFWREKLEDAEVIKHANGRQNQYQINMEDNQRGGAGLLGKDVKL